MGDVTSEQSIAHQVGDKALEFVQVKIRIPLLKRSVEELEVDVVLLSVKLKSWSGVDSLSDLLDEISHGHHSEFLDDSEDTRADELV